MTTRILNWFFSGNPDMQAYYAEQDYSPERIRLHSKNPPGTDCQVDIRDDGESILSSYAELGGNETLEELAGGFPNYKPAIEEGSVITCHIINPGGVGSLSIQLEMEAIAEAEIDE